MMESNSVKIEAGASLLETLTSALYADPIVVFREYVQNSVDSFTLVKDTNRELEVSITVDIQRLADAEIGAAEVVPLLQLLDCYPVT